MGQDAGGLHGGTQSTRVLPTQLVHLLVPQMHTRRCSPHRSRMAPSCNWHTCGSHHKGFTGGGLESPGWVERKYKEAKHNLAVIKRTAQKEEDQKQVEQLCGLVSLRPAWKPD